MKNFGVFYFFLAVSLAAPAEEFSCPGNLSVDALYEYAYGQDQYYQKGSCNTNIWKLLKLFEACGIELPEARVIYIVEDDLNLTLEQSRGGPALWYFHVVLEVAGQIYDFDYRRPVPLPKSVYFSTMFSIRAKDGWRGISARIIPADEYRRLHQVDRTERFGFYYFLLPENSNYPQSAIREYLNSIRF